MNRVQTLRSSVAGQRPAGRLPGELYVNWPDIQLGVISDISQPVDLIAVRYFSTLTNYAIGDFVIQGGELWRALAAVAPGPFNPAQWVANLMAGDPISGYLPLTGGVLTGPLFGTAATFANLNVTGVATITGPNSLVLSAAAGNQRAIIGQTLNSFRWQLVLGDTAAESGGNAGSNFELVALSDAGTILSTPLKVNRATGLVTIPNLSPAPIGDNRIINGDMRIDQKNNGASGTALGYTVDRWALGGGLTGRGTWQRVTGVAPLLAQGFGYVLSFTSNSAYTPLAGDTLFFYQPVEADMVADLNWGAAGAQPVTLSFLVWSNQAGNFSGSLKNAAGPATRSYPFTFAVAASAWTKIAVTIPGDTAGAWVLQGNAIGLVVSFNLGCGATTLGPANAWAGANYNGVTGTNTVVQTNGGVFQITGVKLEIGSVATPFNRQSLAKTLADCQRYYQIVSPILFGGYQPAAGNIWAPIVFMTSMRSAPTIAFPAPVYVNASTLVAINLTSSGCTASASVLAAGNATVNSQFNLTAEL